MRILLDEIIFSYKLFRLTIQEQLPATEAEAYAYVQRLAELLDDPKQELIFSHLYENLTILDAKAASLLQFNSILVAVFTIFLTTESSSLSLDSFCVAVAGILSTLISCSLLLEVVWVHWSTSSHMTTPEAHGSKLLEVRKERTVLYRIAWNCSKGALLSILLMVLLLVAHRLI